MKTALFKVSGEPAAGDLAVMAYTTPRGGMSSAMYKIKGAVKYTVFDEITGEETKVDRPGDTAETIAQGLANAINDSKGEFCPGEFEASTKGDLLIVTCSDLVEDVIFLPQVQVSGTSLSTAKIEEL